MMNGHGEKLTRLQGNAIAALLTAPTLAVAARQANVSPRTLRNWLKRPEFRAAFKEAGRDNLSVTMTRLQGLASESIEALQRLLICGKPATEVRAAGLILENAFKVANLIDLQARVEALERGQGGCHGTTQ